MMQAHDIELTLTCRAAPEQYDAYWKGVQVGYLRLRHGWFYAAVPDVGGDVVYEAEPEGESSFLPTEREGYLLAAREAIAAHYADKEQPT